MSRMAFDAKTCAQPWPSRATGPPSNDCVAMVKSHMVSNVQLLQPHERPHTTQRCGQCRRRCVRAARASAKCVAQAHVQTKPELGVSTCRSDVDVPAAAIEHRLLETVCHTTSHALDPSRLQSGILCGARSKVPSIRQGMGCSAPALANTAVRATSGSCRNRPTEPPRQDAKLLSETWPPHAPAQSAKLLVMPSPANSLTCSNTHPETTAFDAPRGMTQKEESGE